MPNALDPYREALVIEENTEWPEALVGKVADLSVRAKIEKQLHASPAEATELAYQRLHAGFQRKITVTEQDLERIKTKV